MNKRSNQVLTFIALSMAFVGGAAMARPQVEADLENYGKRLPGGFVTNTIAYKGTEQTMSEPLVTYLVTFSTNDRAFTSNKQAATEKAAFAENTGKRLIWEKKFCTEELKKIIRRAGVNVASGQIVDRAGKTQFVAMCFRD